LELSEIRRLLLDQHTELRTIIGELEAAALRVAAGDSAAVRVVDASIQALATALAAHHAAEDAHLASFLPGADAWGTERAKLLRERHDASHAVMDAAVAEAASPAASSAARAATALSLATALREHMSVEEKYILTESLLRDDGIIVEFGG